MATTVQQHDPPETIEDRVSSLEERMSMLAAILGEMDEKLVTMQQLLLQREDAWDETRL